jgi:CheY-like chemotaxis protein
MVLVSDDSDGWRNCWESELVSQGFRVTQASDEDQTVGAALRLRPTVIITDNQKGRDNLSGLRMTERIARMPELEETLLFMFSADEVDGPFYWNGGDLCIPKTPGTLKLVSRILWEYLDD